MYNFLTKRSPFCYIFSQSSVSGWDFYIELMIPYFIASFNNNFLKLVSKMQFWSIYYFFVISSVNSVGISSPGLSLIHAHLYPTSFERIEGNVNQLSGIQESASDMTEGFNYGIKIQSNDWFENLFHSGPFSEFSK